MVKKIRNIAVLAHVDAGKTTVTENFLYTSGSIKSLGSVDKGTSQTDFLPVEKERGISIKSSNFSFTYKDILINLIDTPGHVDFSAEVERTLNIIDGAILIISAVEGVQAHTETIWNALHEKKIPTIIFINKVDRIGADIENTILEIKRELSDNIVELNKVENEGQNNVQLGLRWNDPQFVEELTEIIANTNEEILEKYIANKPILIEELNKHLNKTVQEGNLFPVLFGSAKFSLGIDDLLESIVRFLPGPKGKENLPLSAYVYKIEFDKKAGKLAFVRFYNGLIKNRDIIRNYSQGIDEKVTFIKKTYGNKTKDIPQAIAGDIAIIQGFANVKAGDILGNSCEEMPKETSLKSPLLTVRIEANNEKDYPALAEAMQILSYEDPTLNFNWLKEERELHLQIMGWMQMEVLEKVIEDRFKIMAKFKEPTVIYKETPATKGEGFVRYWMPKPCWAIMKFLIEPGERGSGVVYKSKVGVNDIHQKYQNEVERTIKPALKQGIKGWEVTDLKITLVEGEDHEMHSHPGDFVVATPMGIMNGLVNTGTKFLEPIISFKISSPENLLGAITSDINKMRGSFESPEINGNRFVIQGVLPVATSLDFPVRLNSRSGGKAKISTKFIGYRECADEYGVERKYKGISPLETSKWILKARKALQ
ncbi:MAG: TetM/TetW/TetO/TetS family tetracycline resistance ribosomal protection protein [Chlorobi bacterium]|nr:TetM/TetW/TetO/TetS family tetracycline resistance ribosomal protection protein [Chlorobiota bacterium]